MSKKDVFFTFCSLFIVRRTIPDLLDIPEIIEIAKHLRKTPAQVLLKWIIKRGIAAIPKSANANRLRQNRALFDFDLSDAEMEIIAELDQGFRVVDFDFFPGYVEADEINSYKNLLTFLLSEPKSIQNFRSN